MKRFPQINRIDPLSISRDQYDLENTILHGQFDTLPRDLVNVVDVSDAFFNKGSRLKTYDQRAYYRDTNHLTKYGADYYLGAALEDIMTQILDRR